MSDRKIYLFRHGEIEERMLGRYVGHTDVGLSVKGRMQNRRISDFVRSLGDVCVVASDLKRTFEGIDCVIGHYSDLREIDFGQWEGKSWKEICEVDNDLAEKYLRDPVNFQFPGGESISLLRDRVIPCYSELLESTNEDMVLILHAGAIKIILMFYSRLQLEDMFDVEFGYGELGLEY